MKFSGERFIPNLGSPEISYEHWHRYLYASHFVKGKTVLDIACGEGYGSYLLSQTAKHVVGVDVSSEAINHAASTYARGNLEFKLGSAISIPVEESRSFDYVISFETIEHIREEEQETFLAEVKRLLKPDGILLVSTPNKLVYSDIPGSRNEFHHKEFYLHEFRTFLSKFFKNVRLLGQKIYSGSHIWDPDAREPRLIEYRLLETDSGFRPTEEPKVVLYLIGWCSDVETASPPESVLLDLSEKIVKIRDEQIASLQRANAVLRELTDRLREIESSTYWRMTAPLRSILAHHPRLRALARRGVELARRASTLGGWLAERRQPQLADSEPAPPELQEAGAVALPLMASEARSAVVQTVDVSHGALAGRPRIVFVSGEAHTPGHFYRVARYAEAAAAAGTDVSVVAIEDAQKHLADVSRADLVVIWRATWDDRVDAVVRAARASGGKVLFDVDDLMFDPALATIEVIDGIRSQGLAEKPVRKFYERIRATLSNADVCTAPTASLAQRIRRASGKAAFILPNGFDAKTLEVSRMVVRARRKTPSDGRIRIGYATGSRTHQRDFSMAAEPISRVLRRHPECRLVLFRSQGQEILDVSEFPELTDLMAQIEWRAFVPLAELPAEIARFDINLAPLEVGNPFCEAKSELKFVEAALVDVPTVASPTEPYRKAIHNGVTGFLASTPEEWHEAIERLVADWGLRTRMAQAAFYDVLWTYGPERRIEIMVSLVEQLLQGGRRGARTFELDLARSSYSRSQVPLIPDHDILFECDKLKSSSVTIIVPLYNYASHVEEALSSVKAQTLVDLDLVVVDDASTDNSLEVARQWLEDNERRFNRVALARNRVNSGLGLTRNVGFALAETAYVLPLDADNQLLPECAARCLAAVQASTAAYAYPLIQQFGEGDGTMGSYDYQPALFRLDNYIDAMALVRKAAWALVGGYWETRIGWEDYDLWCKFVERGLFGVQVREKLARYRVHHSSMTAQQHITARARGGLVSAMMNRHPWLTIPEVTPSTAVPKRTRERYGDRSGAELATGATVATAVVTGSSMNIDPARIGALLSILRCPVTRDPLNRVDDTALRSVHSGRVWPIVYGRPVLFAGLDTPKIMPQTHLSNELPERAEALMRDADGWVLHLSAGGTARRRDNVVEVEAAIFRNTDIVADAHALPFADASFDAVVALNAFEHYHSPLQAAREIHRVLKPGGRVMIRTAFLQPLHEAPVHFYNCTRYGLEKWFEAFEILDLQVSDNFNPAHTLSWIASEAESALRRDVSASAADAFLRARCGDLVRLWRDPARRGSELWRNFFRVRDSSREVLAAGFELVARRVP